MPNYPILSASWFNERPATPRTPVPATSVENLQAAKSGGFKTTEQEYAKARAPVPQAKILI
jgi:hypothetical protein